MQTIPVAPTRLSTNDTYTFGVAPRFGPSRPLNVGSAEQLDVTVPELLMLVRPAWDHDHHEGAPLIVTVNATYWLFAIPGALNFTLLLPCPEPALPQNAEDAAPEMLHGLVLSRVPLALRTSHLFTGPSAAVNVHDVGMGQVATATEIAVDDVGVYDPAIVTSTAPPAAGAVAVPATVVAVRES